MEWWQILLGGSLMAAATVVVAIITTRANRAVEQLRLDVERQKAAGAERAEDRERFEAITTGLRSDLERLRARLVILEDRDLAHTARAITHMPWDTRAQTELRARGVDIGEPSPLL